MKKFLCILITLVIVLGLTAPAAASTSYATEQKELTEAIPFECDIIVMDAGVMPYIQITYDCESIDADSIDDFGQIIYIAKEYCKNSFAQYELKIYIHDLKNNSTPLTWNSNFIHFGTLCDNRNGSRDETQMYNLEDLYAFFPNLEQEISSSESASGSSHISAGASSASPFLSATEPITVPEATEPTGDSFIVNKSSKKFHRMGCSFAPDENSKNYSVVNSTRESLEQQGYQPCKKCFNW